MYVCIVGMIRVYNSMEILSLRNSRDELLSECKGWYTTGMGYKLILLLLKRHGVTEFYSFMEK